MENTYGIGITNRYALFLDDDNDPFETVIFQELTKEAKKKTKVSEKENKGKQETQPQAKGKTNQVPKKVVRDAVNKPQEKRDEPRSNVRANSDGKPERPYNKSNSENREERNNRKNRDGFQGFNEPRSEFRKDRDDRIRKDNNSENYENRNRGDRVDRNNERNNRGFNNKPGAPRGARRFDDRRGKREFDRQSGSDKTGVKHIDKRDGSGSHNWGSHKDVIEEADNKPTDADNNWGETEPVNATTTESPNKEEQTEPETPAVEEPKELTLDEWKAQRAGRSKPTYNLRKAGEGEDPSQWKKMYELKRKDDEEQESEEEEFDASDYPQRVGRQKHILDIDIQFNDNRRPGIGRGKGPRTGGGIRGKNPRGERPERRPRDEHTGGERGPENRRAPKVDDERDFPSLG